MKSRQYFYFFVIICFFISCSDHNKEITINENPELTSSYFPPINSEIWETISAADIGWNIEAQSELFDFLEEKGTKAFIILKDGRIVIEKYFDNATANDRNPWNSVSKTLTAFTIGIAKEEGLLSIDDISSDYLGKGWSNLNLEQENKITIRNHLTMTTGLDYSVDNTYCTDKECLTYKNEPGKFWYYHNAPYTLLTKVIEGASSKDYQIYFDEKIKNKIGMDGIWIHRGYNRAFLSTARSMARFGLLNLNKGVWDTTEILTDLHYFEQMTTSSQNINPSYGFLWWLNGQKKFMVPGSELQFTEKLIPNAPDDLIAGLGKNDQKLYVVPSKNIVVVRMGNNAGETLLGPSSFDNLLWKKLNSLIP